MDFFTGNYHLAGLASAFFMALSLSGLIVQVRFIWQRKKQRAAGRLAGELPTSALSLNRFAASYFGFYALLVYGLCLQPLNHYLVWPRVLAEILLLAVFYALWLDRRGLAPAMVLAAGVALLLVAAALPAMSAAALLRSAAVAQALVVLSALVFLQGAVHQVVKIRREGRTGGLSLRMHQLSALKDTSLVLFGAAMGFGRGWPLLLIGGVSLAMQVVTMGHFHWARTSPAARRRRAACRR
ncbi:MAG: hypothetical protein OXU29_08900 [Gammaproteobacteria bacterium]|nr:hypothetical protein [Gammaproteobacteria bacterium]